MQIITQDGRNYPLRLGENTLGRGPDNAIVVPNVSVSRHHACLYWDGSVLFVSDSGSVNGTWLDGRRLAPGERSPVRPGAALRFGDDLNVRAVSSPEPAYQGAPAGPQPVRPPAAPPYVPPASPYPGAAFPAAPVAAPVAAVSSHVSAAKGGVDLLLAAVDVSLSRNKLIMALAGTLAAGLILGLATFIATRIAFDGPVFALLFTAFGAILAWLAVTLTIGAVTRMSLNDLTGRPSMSVSEAAQYAFRRLPEFALAPLALAALVAIVVLAEVVVMLVGRVGGVGQVLASLLFVPAVVVNLFLIVLVLFGNSLLFPIIVDRGRGVFGGISYLLKLMRKTPGRVIFYLGFSMIVTWLATLALWMLVSLALAMTMGVLTSGAGIASAGSMLTGGALGMLPMGDALDLLGGLGGFGSASSILAGRLLQLGTVLTLAVAFAFPLVLQVAMGAAVYLNVKDEVTE